MSDTTGTEKITKVASFAHTKDHGWLQIRDCCFSLEAHKHEDKCLAGKIREIMKDA